MSVVVITRDRVDELSQALARLGTLPERPEIIVVDNGSRDGTPELVARGFPHVILIALDGDQGAAARTIGARAASSRHVAFSDDDSWWTPGSLRRAVAVLDAHPSVALVAARVLLGDACVADPACELMAASPLPTPPELPGRRILGFVACGAVVRRDAFLSVGGFAAGYGMGAEEVFLAAALAERGWDLLYVDDLVVHHHPSARRDRDGRRAMLVRNDLWFTWLRRPLLRSITATARALPAACHDRAVRAGLRDALAGVAAGSVLARRRPLPAAVEAELRLLDLVRPAEPPARRVPRLPGSRAGLRAARLRAGRRFGPPTERGGA